MRSQEAALQEQGTPTAGEEGRRLLGEAVVANRTALEVRPLPRMGRWVPRPTTARQVEIRDAAGMMLGRILGALANGWACLPGSPQPVMLLAYTAGGHCEVCEWHEIYRLDGRLVATSRSSTAGPAYRRFQRAYRRLGLPEPWPRAAFASIPMLR